MPTNSGTIVIMGSGELTATMVEVHKAMLQKLGRNAQAVFLDTPAGFQLNADHIAQKAAIYFKDRVQHPLQIASFKSAQTEDKLASQQAFDMLHRADYLLIGPGSPTYALNQWQQSPVPQIMIERIHAGGCLVAASAAALTIGAQTLPVYEIYKVGLPPHWVSGMDILGHFGFNLIVVPHWNNAEGGNHDTRYCFMGAPRLARLEALLERPVPLLGLDEHTALIIDLASQNATIEGVGQVTLRWQGQDHIFSKGMPVPLSMLQGQFSNPAKRPTGKEVPASLTRKETPADDIWTTIHLHANNLRQALDQGNDTQAAGSLLDLERYIWNSQDQLEEHNEMGAAREVLREMISLLAARMVSRPISKKACLTPLVEALIQLRHLFRAQKKWEEADALRNSLQKSGIRIEDGADGPLWTVDKEDSI